MPMDTHMGRVTMPSSANSSGRLRRVCALDPPRQRPAEQDHDEFVAAVPAFPSYHRKGRRTAGNPLSEIAGLIP
jgi:hypothetical protein